MKRWIRSAAWLYPAQWRERYGAEFEALLEDAPLRWSDLVDVIRGALMMQMTNWSYPKTALLAGLAGLILLGGYSFTIPDRFICTAVMTIHKGPDTTRDQMSDELRTAERSILRRDNLIAMIHDPRLDLYPKERQRESIADVAEGAFRKHVKVLPFDSSDSDTLPFRIVFEYPEPKKASAVVGELVSEFVLWNLQYHTIPGMMSVLENPVTPEKPAGPLRLAFVILGAIGGSILGLVSFGIFRRTRTYAVVTVNIPKETSQFVEGRIAAGQYRDVSEYVRELIRADRERQN